MTLQGKLQLSTLHTVSWPSSCCVLIFSVYVCDNDDDVTQSLFQLRFRSLDLLTVASIQLPASSPMFLQEARPFRQVSSYLLTLKFLIFKFLFF